MIKYYDVVKKTILFLTQNISKHSWNTGSPNTYCIFPPQKKHLRPSPTRQAGAFLPRRAKAIEILQASVRRKHCQFLRFFFPRRIGVGVSRVFLIFLELLFWVGSFGQFPWESKRQNMRIIRLRGFVGDSSIMMFSAWIVGFSTNPGIFPGNEKRTQGALASPNQLQPGSFLRFFSLVFPWFSMAKPRSSMLERGFFHMIFMKLRGAATFASHLSQPEVPWWTCRCHPYRRPPTSEAVRKEGDGTS